MKPAANIEITNIHPDNASWAPPVRATPLVHPRASRDAKPIIIPPPNEVNSLDLTLMFLPLSNNTLKFPENRAPAIAPRKTPMSRKIFQFKSGDAGVIYWEKYFNLPVNSGARTLEPTAVNRAM